MAEKQVIRPNWNGDPSVDGTRLTVYAIMDHYLTGADVNTIATFYRIPAEHAAAAAEYIRTHSDELMPVYREMLRRSEVGNSPEVIEKMRRSGEKLRELKAVLRSRAGASNAPAPR